MRCVGVRRVEAARAHRNWARFVQQVDHSKHCTRLRLASDGLTHEAMIFRLLQTDLARIAHLVFLDDVPYVDCAQSLTDSILVTARP